MRTDSEVKADIYRIVSGSPVGEAIDGEVLRRKRKDDSCREDCVISVLDGDTGQIQSHIVNVNIYVRDIMSDGEMVEDERRTALLQRLCAEAFGDKSRPRYGGGTIYWTEAQRVLPVAGKDEHVINNRIHYQYNNE